MWKQYDHTHVHAPEVHTWDTTRGEGEGDESEFSFWFCSFGFGCNSSSFWGAEQLHPAAAAAGGEATTLSAGREIRSGVASDINIFGTLPNWQGKLFVRPTDQPGGERLGGLFLVLVWVASRRYCGNAPAADDDDGGDDDGTSCSRSCSVSIQTVVLSKPSSSVAGAVLPCPYEWCCMSRGMGVCRSVPILPGETPSRTQCSGLVRSGPESNHCTLLRCHHKPAAIDSSAQPSRH